MEVRPTLSGVLEVLRRQISIQRVAICVGIAGNRIAAADNHVLQLLGRIWSTPDLLQERRYDCALFNHIALVVKLTAPNTAANMALLTAGPLQEMQLKLGASGRVPTALRMLGVFVYLDRSLRGP